MSNDTLRILRAADELLADESRWTQGVMARRRDQKRCSSVSLNAVCWCLEGALARTADYLELRESPPYAYWEAAEQLRHDAGYAVSDYNDEPRRTFPEVKALLRRTIERVEAEG